MDFGAKHMKHEAEIKHSNTYEYIFNIFQAEILYS